MEEDLNNRKNDFEKKASEDKKKIYAEGLQAMEDNRLVDNALQVDDVAAYFTLPNASAKRLRFMMS